MHKPKILADLTYIHGSPHIVSPGSTGRQKVIYGGTYLSVPNRWYYPAYKPFFDRVRADLNAQVIVAPTERLKEYVRALDAGPVTSLGDFKFITEPDEHQRIGVLQGINYPRLGLIYDCGAGKTKTAIDIVRFYDWLHRQGKSDPRIALQGAKPKTLVIVKASVLYNWRREIDKHSEEGYTVYEVISRARPARVDGTRLRNTRYDIIDAAAGDGDFLVITYDLARRADVADYIKEHYKYNVIIADESHKMRSYESAITSTALKLSQNAAVRLILSATPTLGDPRHVFSQMRFLAPCYTGGNYSSFCARYLKKTPQGFVYGFRNLDKLNTLLSFATHRVTGDKFVTTRLLRHVHEVELTKQQRKAYNGIVENKGITLPKIGAIELEEPIQKLLAAHQVCSGFIERYNAPAHPCTTCPFIAKCEEERIEPFTQKCEAWPDGRFKDVLRFKDNPKILRLVDLVEDILLDNSNAIILAHRYNRDRDFIIEALVKAGYGPDLILPGLIADKKKKFEAAEAFEKGKGRIYVAQISTLVGINLTRATHTIYYSLSFDLQDLIQARGRNLRRTTTHKQVHEHFLCAANTMESTVVTLLDDKEAIKKLLTDRQECLTCTRYNECQRANILPWTTDCVLDRSKDKRSIKLRVL